ncbi:hypothetical protein QUF64_10145 [Anaerolineales bacterium HSG6]|nr:hypothetical protein [Anaerolineales bacterium HSG6]MDM8531509.1 hypothetical protein [Anaerolineales bacterium HSG25]
MGQFDFKTIQWARRITVLNQQFSDLSPTELEKLSVYLVKLAQLRASDGELTEQQQQVIFQHLHIKELIELTPLKKGNIQVEFSGKGLEYERFLIRPDGRVPNHKYESKKSTSS